MQKVCKEKLIEKWLIHGLENSYSDKNEDN